MTNMPSMDIQSEQFEQLLAEALRAGPGSPAWHQAVQVLREAGRQGDEYRLLCLAREDLASGREYRSVRAGPGFTRKLMDNIEHARAPWSLPTADIIAILAAAIIIGVIGAISWTMFSPARQGESAAQLANTYFVTTLKREDFRSGIPDDFQKIGLLPLAFDNGVKLAAQTRTGDKPVGGGVHLTTALATRKSYAIETFLEISDPKSDLITQIFVADKPEFAPDTGLSAHELACIIDQGIIRVVLPNGKTAGDTDLTLDAQTACDIRIRINAESAIVEHNGKPIWAGRHYLSPDRPRLIGLRYLSRGGKNPGGVTIKSLKLMEP